MSLLTLLIWVAPFSPLNSSYNPYNHYIKIYILYFYLPDQILRLKYAIKLFLFPCSPLFGHYNNESNKITKRCRLHRNPLWLVIYLWFRYILGTRKTGEDRSFKAGQVNGSSWKSHLQTIQTFLKDFMFRQTLQTCTLLPIPHSNMLDSTMNPLSKRLFIVVVAFDVDRFWKESRLDQVIIIICLANLTNLFIKINVLVSNNIIAELVVVALLNNIQDFSQCGIG